MGEGGEIIISKSGHEIMHKKNFTSLCMNGCMKVNNKYKGTRHKINIDEFGKIETFHCGTFLTDCRQVRPNPTECLIIYSC